MSALGQKQTCALQKPMSRQFPYKRKMFWLVPRPHHCRPNIAEGRERHHKLCHRFVVGRIVKMNEVIGTKSHPDSPSFNTELFSDFARSVLPVWDFLDALEPLIREIHQRDVCRHQNLPRIASWSR